MRVREVVQRLREDGWQETKGKGTSHRQFVHPTKLGKVTVPNHPGDVPRWVLHSIWKQAGLR